MEVLINELSLNGQFLSIDIFLQDALISFVNTINELDRNKDIILKKQDFWNCKITENNTLHSLLLQPSNEATLVKSLIRNFGEPFWENSKKHNVTDSYLFLENNISGSSLAESCERERIVISFLHSSFSQTSLQINKNNQETIAIDNLFKKGQYTDVAYFRRQLSMREYYDRKFDEGCISLLENEYRFRKTGRFQQGKVVYEEIKTGYLWYLDNLHKDHYEVFNNKGQHIGEANLQGFIDSTTKDYRKTFE